MKSKTFLRGVKFLVLLVTFLFLQAFIHVQWGFADWVPVVAILPVLITHNAISGKAFYLTMESKKKWAWFVARCLQTIIAISYLLILWAWVRVTDQDVVANSRMVSELCLLTLIVSIGFHYFVIFHQYRRKGLYSFTSALLR